MKYAKFAAVVFVLYFLGYLLSGTITPALVDVRKETSGTVVIVKYKGASYTINLDEVRDNELPETVTIENPTIIPTSGGEGQVRLRKGDVVTLLNRKDDSLIVEKPDSNGKGKISPKDTDLFQQLVKRIYEREAGGAIAAATPPATVVAPAPAPAAPASVKQVSEEISAVGAAGPGDLYVGPAVRKLAREFGVHLVQVTGSGPKGRILKEDVQAYVAKRLSEPASSSVVAGTGIPPVADVDFAKFGSVRREVRSRIDKVTAANMSKSWLNVPHVTQFDDADITDMESFRKSLKAEAERRGSKLSPLPFIIKAVALALNENPKIKSSLAEQGEALIYKDYCHIGMAVDTPNGLVVPVIRDADNKSIWMLSDEIRDLAAKAKDKKLKPDEMQGAVFTISSLGNIGGRGFTPIVNTPEVGILGVSKASTQPVWDGEAFQPRVMLPVSLSYDHRVVNGGDAGRFLAHLVTLLGDIRQLAMR